MSSIVNQLTRISVSQKPDIKAFSDRFNIKVNERNSSWAYSANNTILQINGDSHTINSSGGSNVNNASLNTTFVSRDSDFFSDSVGKYTPDVIGHNIIKVSSVFPASEISEGGGGTPTGPDAQSWSYG